MSKTVRVGPVCFGSRSSLPLIAGPCVIEGREACIDLAKRLVSMARRHHIPFVFKASFDKANRSSIDSYRGPGLEEGLQILAEIRERFNVPVLTDFHTPEQAQAVGAVVDILQIPAFLSRQTDLVVAAAETGKVVNIKKAQFMAPEDMVNVIAKAEKSGNRRLLLTERGVSFGYHNLVADMRSLLVMREFGYPVIFDATHSVQRPGGAGNRSGGDGHLAPALARAAVATGCDGLFVETHTNPKEALSDRDNAMPLAVLGRLWRKASRIHALVANE